MAYSFPCHFLGLSMILGSSPLFQHSNASLLRLPPDTLNFENSNYSIPISVHFCKIVIFSILSIFGFSKFRSANYLRLRYYCDWMCCFLQLCIFVEMHAVTWSWQIMLRIKTFVIVVPYTHVIVHNRSIIGMHTGIEVIFSALNKLSKLVVYKW